MKAKLSLDTGAIKGFFAEHGEKFVLVAGLLVMLLFISKIFTQETLPANLQAPAIKQIAMEAEDNVRKSKPREGELTFNMPTQTAKTDGGRYNDYIEPLFKPVIEDPDKRTDPTLFPVVALQAVGMDGAMELGGTGPESRAVVQPTRRGRGFDPSRPNMRPAQGLDSSAPRKGNASTPATRDSSAPTSSRGHAVAAQGSLGPGRGLTPAAATPKATTPATGTAGEADAEVEKPIPPEMQLPGLQAMGGPVEPRSFVMITGAIPWEKQFQEYEMRFAHAQKGESSGNQNPMTQQQESRDLPKYVWWRLERVDLTNGEEKTIIDFGDLDQIRDDVLAYTGPVVIQGIHPTTTKGQAAYKHLLADMKTWQNNPNEVVPPEYLDAVWLTWSLPPILLHDWGHEATNPLIPLTSPQAADDSDTKPGDAKQTEPDAFSGQSPDAATAPTGRQTPQFSRSRDSSAPRGGRGFAVPVRGSSRPVAVGRAPLPADEETPVQYKLFRFTDFDVQPGHSYRYRVQLVLKNPNFGVSADALANPNVKPEPYRDTPWSEFSGTASVPASPRLLAASIDRAKGKEARGRVGILAWKKDSTEGAVGAAAGTAAASDTAAQPENAVQLLDTDTIELGAVANFVKKKVEDVIDPSRHTRRDFTAEFLSNAALIDVHGPGTVEIKPKPGSAVKAEAPEPGEPAEMLVFVIGKDGAPDQLAVTSQAMDQLALDAWVKSHKVPEELDNPPDNAATPVVTPSAPTRGSGRLGPAGNGRTNPSGGRGAK